MPFPFRNMQAFIRNCIEPHIVAMRTQLATMVTILKNIFNVDDLAQLEKDSMNSTLTHRGDVPPTNTNLLWLNPKESTLNYYDDTLKKWVSIVGRFVDAP